MRIVILAVGRVRGALEDAVAGYEERAGHYWKLDRVEVEAGAAGREEPEAVRTAEAERILARLPGDLEVVALTREGKGMTSRGLARWLGGKAVRGAPGVCFLIGGAYGLDASVLDRSRRRLTFSPMTLPHEMARLILAEQLYRAGSILRNEPYHKGP